MTEEEIRVPLYPELFPTTLRTEKQTFEMIDVALNKSRIDEMFNKRDELHRRLCHLKKMKCRWGEADICLKITGIIAAGTGIVAGAVTAILTPPLIVPMLVAALTAGESVLTSGLIIGLTSSKKSYYRERIRAIQSCLDKMFVYIQKCQLDHIISIEELEGFRNLFESQYQNGIEKINVDYDYEKLKKEAKNAADKQVKDL